MRLLSAMVLAATLLQGAASVQAATIYKWVDSTGQTHFGSQPPAGLESERMSGKRFTPPASTQQPAAAQPAGDDAQKEIDKKVAKQVAKELEERRQYCVDVRTRLSHLKNNPRMMAEIEGQMVRLSEDQRQQRIKEAEGKIAEHCTDI